MSSSSELSELTSNVSSDIEEDTPAAKKSTLDHYFKNTPKSAQPPKLKKKRPPSPPHQYVLADREEVAFIVMFRSRFSDVFPKSLLHLGPQDIENGVEGPVASDQVEKLLCSLLGLVLNRKKEIEKGHYTRALEDAISQHQNQWPVAWQGKNPLSGNRTFNGMTAEEKLVLLKALVLWSLDSSDAIKSMIKDFYKQSRHEDDLNQPLSVQAWGRDGDKRRFWLIEGQDDTHFRLYRESNPKLKTVTWRSIAGSIEELRLMGDRLGEEDTLASRKLRDRIVAAIPRFEAGEEKRKRRDYRLARKAQFRRPEPGFSLYEGRTRGKRQKYTFSDDEDITSDAASTRRSNRQSGNSTPAEPATVGFTASGRQVRSRHSGAYVESLLSRTGNPAEQGEAAAMDVDDGDEELVARGRGRPRRSMQPNGTGMHAGGTSTRGTYSSEASDDDSEANPSSNEWNGEDENDADEKDDDQDEDEDLDMSDDEIAEAEAQDESSRLVVRLKYSRGSSKSPQTTSQPNGTTAIDQTSTRLPSSSLLGPDQDDDLFNERPQPSKSNDPSSAEIPLKIPKPDEVSIVQNDSDPPISTDTKQTSPSGHEDAKARLSPSPAPPTAAFQPQAFVYHDGKS